MGIVICESEFVTPDRNNPDYSLTEIDFYAWIPARFHKTERNHRLKLWKNLKTGKYELVKDYKELKSGITNLGGINVGLTTNIETGESKVVFANENLEAVLIEANGMWNHYHSGWAERKREPDKICEHKYPDKSFSCRM